ncbi:glycosyltransferase family 2 protein [Clostridium gasigenes]|uniref:Glycosyltransferase involved in cell wall bisynthesis n=1 Tax=Clostridium gasigenes TaxID=94869 RepID=A0A1H0UJD9_9CLOT|nr:glycosyltransferase family 2 protein [Clostridium gasigenes]SDP65976.1 Glycosyltransferase involved in cell wall bisynthesis [Clostridium gasigenes]
MKKIYLVVPCYNEEEVLCETAKRLELKMKTLIDNKDINEYSRVIFVDDGSKDKTWSIIEELKNNNELFGGIKLSRNRGHQNALLAGLMTVKDECDAVISLDADLQDDINVIDKFIEKFYEGCEVVYGVRSDRKSDTFFKRSTAQGFYKVIKFLGVDIIYNHADYRLMSRKALDSLAEFKEVNLFLRGIVPLVGFKSDIVSYERNERFAGESKYPLKKMISFAFEGITSFSVKPIRLVLVMGIIMFFSSLTALAYFLVTWINGYTVQGWTTVVASIWMLGGIQLLCLGVIGEYVGKIYIEVKSRPKYIIDQFIIKSEEK